jgi:endo-1,3-1,4-beta-glycanase ExoK
VDQILDDRPAVERPYSCGELQSMEFYGYGTYEVRLRSIAASGVVTGFFTYTGPPHGAGKRHDEIDFEFMGRAPGQVQLNYFAAGKGNHGRDIDLGFNAAETTADYAFQWTPDAIRWFVNRKLVHEVKRSGDEPWPLETGKIYLSIWTGIGLEAWMGRFVYPGHPLVASYEHVAFTALGEPCRFPTSVLCGEAR